MGTGTLLRLVQPRTRRQGRQMLVGGLPDDDRRLACSMLKGLHTTCTHK
jgi:hypothetical protein